MGGSSSSHEEQGINEFTTDMKDHHGKLEQDSDELEQDSDEINLNSVRRPGAATPSSLTNTKSAECTTSMTMQQCIPCRATPRRYSKDDMNLRQPHSNISNINHGHFFGSSSLPRSSSNSALHSYLLKPQLRSLGESYILKQKQDRGRKSNIVRNGTTDIQRSKARMERTNAAYVSDIANSFGRERSMLSITDDYLLDVARKSKIAIPRKQSRKCGRAEIYDNFFDRRRVNSTNSIFMTENVSKILDHGSLLQCVAAVTHSHIHNSEGESSGQYKVFFEDRDIFSRPDFSDVHNFIDKIFTQAQLEPECLIVALVYLERLLKMSRSEIILGFQNWRPIVVSCLFLASKVWDDLSMINGDFSYICRGMFSLQQINKLEVALLSALKFKVRVSLSEYAKYYFKLRAMLGTGALEKDSMTPLSIEGAMNLEVLSSSFADRLRARDSLRKRSQTLAVETELDNRKTNKSQITRRASLEQMIRSNIIRNSSGMMNDESDEDPFSLVFA